jgi:hypothetical protein
VTGCYWLTSPLRRAIETARLLGLETARSQKLTMAERRR